MLSRTLRVSCVSDIHLGNRNNKTRYIIANLDKYFSNDEHLSKVDLILLAGDVFDDLLSLSGGDVQYIYAWVARLLRICARHNVMVRVLEGTPSHDRGQSECFTVVNDIHEKNNGKRVNLKHVKELSIEHIEEFDLDVLYVPDEWCHTTEATLEQVRDLLAEKNLDKVDIACMHGQFSYQLPAHIPGIPRHDENAYMDLVRHLIYIGHIHVHSRNDKIIAQGSFDRISHGEEGPKGFVTSLIHPDGSNETTFVVNETARKYITVTCPYEDVEENLKVIDRAVEDLPEESFVRIEAHYANAILTNLNTLRSRWPLLIWSSIARDKDEKKNSQITLIQEESLYVPIHIDRHNLSQLVMPRLKTAGIADDILQRCAANLLEMQKV